jgi:hypothetical protein
MPPHTGDLFFRDKRGNQTRAFAKGTNACFVSRGHWRPLNCFLGLCDEASARRGGQQRISNFARLRITSAGRNNHSTFPNCRQETVMSTVRIPLDANNRLRKIT